MRKRNKGGQEGKNGNKGRIREDNETEVGFLKEVSR